MTLGQGTVLSQLHSISTRGPEPIVLANLPNLVIRTSKLPSIVAHRLKQTAALYSRL